MRSTTTTTARLRPRRAATGSALALGLALTVSSCSLVGGSTSTGSTGAGSTAAGSSSGSGGGTAAASVSASATGASASATDAAAPAGTDVYAGATAGHLSPAAAAARPLVYVPNTQSNTLSEVDPKTFAVVRTIPVGRLPQHVVPSWDLKTLWVNDNAGDTLVPIDPVTGNAGKPVSVVDPYNLYFTPDGKHAMVMAERLHQIYFRDPHTMAIQHVLSVPCAGVNHADFTADGSTFVASCEFSGKLIVVPADGSKVLKVIDLNAVKTPGSTAVGVGVPLGGPAANIAKGVSCMPQDVRLTPDGRTFLAADMLRNGVWLIDASTFTIRGFLHTGAAAHGIYPSRDSRSIYISNRGEGSVSVVDAATLKVTALWKIPGGGSPDMGGVSADGTQLWLSGRYSDLVYVFDTRTGKVIHKVKVGQGPHGLAVWPQPGSYSLGHTGNMR